MKISPSSSSRDVGKMFLSDCQVEDCRGLWRIPRGKLLKSAERLRNISGYKAGRLYARKENIDDAAAITSESRKGTTYLLSTWLQGKSGTSFFYHVLRNPKSLTESLMYPKAITFSHIYTTDLILLNLFIHKIQNI